VRSLCYSNPVDAAVFLDALYAAFVDFPHDDTPRDPLYARILDEVDGLAEPNNLALIAAATSALSEGETYLEAGSFNGASLIAAAHGKRGDFVGIDNFSMRAGSPEQLAANLRAFDCQHARILEGDVFATLESGALDGRKVGAYYYDAGHGHDQQLAGLRLVEPYLADAALLIVDDTDWEQVGQTVDEYLASQPGASDLVRIAGKSQGAPGWWEGMRVLAWRAPSAS